MDTNGYPLIWTNFNNQEDGRDHAKIKVNSEPPGYGYTGVQAATAYLKIMMVYKKTLDQSLQFSGGF